MSAEGATNEMRSPEGWFNPASIGRLHNLSGGKPAFLTALILPDCALRLHPLITLAFRRTTDKLPAITPISH